MVLDLEILRSHINSLETIGNLNYTLFTNGLPFDTNLFERNVI